MADSRPAHAKKGLIIDEISSKMKESQGMVVAEYKNLSVDQMTKLRKMALKQDIEVKVYKDSLVNRAAEASGFKDLAPFLTNQNVYIFSKEDPIAPAKLVFNFAKENPDLILKAGIYEGAVHNTEQINQVALLPSKEELYSMFANSLLYPLRQFMGVVTALADKKQAEAN